MSETLVYPVLIMAKNHEIAYDLAWDLGKTYEFEDTSIQVTTTAATPGPVGERAMNALYEKYFTIICLYFKEQEDVAPLLPMLEVYNNFPVKLMVHTPGVIIPPEASPEVRRVRMTTREDIVKAMKEEKTRVTTQLRIAFDNIDTDKSGFLDVHELIKASKDLGTELSEDEAAATLSKIDRNGDGKISFDEFVYWWNSGKRLFGVSLKDIVVDKLKTSKLAKAGSAALEAVGKVEDTAKASGYIHFGLNLEDKAKVQLILKMATLGPEYNEIKKAYFPQYMHGNIDVAFVLNCRNPEIAKQQVQQMIDVLFQLHSMMVPSEVLTAAEIKPTIKVSGRSILLSISLTKGASADERQKMLEAATLLFPIFKISGQSIDLRVGFGSDLATFATENKPILRHILEGLGVELRTQILRKNIEMVASIIRSEIPRREMPMRIILQMLLLGFVDIKVKIDETLLTSILKDILENTREFGMTFPDLKEMQKEELRRAEESLPPFTKVFFTFFREQLESLEFAAITSDVACNLFAVLPGLGKLLELD